MTSIGEQIKRIWMREYILHSFAKHAIFLYQKCICSKNLNAKCKTHFSDMGVRLWNELLASLRPTNQEIFWTKLHDISFGILADKDNYFDSQTSIIEVTNCKQ